MTSGSRAVLAPAPLRPRHRLARWAGRAALVAAVLLTWPAGLGGRMSYVVVSGTSMLPTYRSGDLVVTRRKTDYAVGDPVVYRVPRAEVGAGAQVVHRIVAGTSATGFTMRGDHNGYADPWTVSRGDVRGRVVLHLPRLGVWLALLLRPLPLGATCAAITMVALWPRRSSDGPSRTAVSHP